jgi:ATP-dependent exoDNAse (exonuclease V) beta subunit
MDEAWSQARNFFAREPLPRLETRDADGMLRGLIELLAFRYEHLNLVDYKSNGKVEAAVAV